MFSNKRGYSFLIKGNIKKAKLSLNIACIKINLSNIIRLCPLVIKSSTDKFIYIKEIIKNHLFGA